MDQQIEAEPLDVEGVTDGHKKGGENLNSRTEPLDVEGVINEQEKGGENLNSLTEPLDDEGVIGGQEKGGENLNSHSEPLDVEGIIDGQEKGGENLDSHTEPLDVEGVINGQEKGGENSNFRIIAPCTGMTFSSEKEVYEFLKSYACQIGFDIWKKSTKNDDDGQQKYFSLACHKSGNGKMNGKIPLNPKLSTKTSCRAKVNVRVSSEGSFIISKVCLDHNHALARNMRYCENSEEKMRYYKLCSRFHKLAEIGAESQENYDILLQWIDEVQAKLVSKTIDVDNVSVELGSEVQKENQHVSSTILLEEQAEGRPSIKRKQSMLKNSVEENRRSKKKVIQERIQNLKPLKTTEEAPSVATDLRGKTDQQIEAESLDNEGAIDRQGSPCVGMTFSSEKEVYEFFKSYARQIGFGICKMSTKNDDDGLQRYYSLACHKSGNRRLKDRLPLKARPSKKTGCKAKINIRVSEGGSFIISKVCLEHNHALYPDTGFGEYGYEEDGMMKDKRKRSKKKVVQEQPNEQSQDIVVTSQRGETSTDMTTSTPVAQTAPDPTVSARSTHNTTPVPPPQPDMHTMAAQITTLQTQLSSVMELLTSRLPPPQPLPASWNHVWPTTHQTNLPVVSRAATHPQPRLDASNGNSLPGHVRPTSNSQFAPFYLNFETNKDRMSHRLL